MSTNAVFVPQTQTRNRTTATFVMLVAASLALYVFTLAPTVLWGDDAAFQRMAWTGELPTDGGGHWLWLRAATLFAKLPFGTVAYRVNLLSAVAGALTVGFVYLTGRALNLRHGAAIVTAVSLAMAHTFWTHAVRAEVYTLFLLLMTIQLWLWFSWRPGRNDKLIAASALFGTTLLAHQMALLLIPAGLAWLWQIRESLFWPTPNPPPTPHTDLPPRSPFIWIKIAFSILALLLPFAIVLAQQGAGDGVRETVWLHFTHSDADFSGAMFDFSLGRLPRDIATWLGMGGLQFVGVAGLLGLLGLYTCVWQRFPAPWRVLGILYLTNWLFAFSYHVNDQYVFYLPSYVVFSLFVGYGWHALSPQTFARPVAMLTLALGLLVLVPVFSYAAVPHYLSTQNKNPLGVRELPGREPNTFFLWPSKRNHTGAYQYAFNALATTPEYSIIIADHTPLEPLRYLQTVERFRPDILLVKIEPGEDLTAVLNALPPNAAVFTADNNPDYYNLSQHPTATLTTANNGLYRITNNNP